MENLERQALTWASGFFLETPYPPEASHWSEDTLRWYASRHVISIYDTLPADVITDQINELQTWLLQFQQECHLAYPLPKED